MSWYLLYIIIDDEIIKIIYRIVQEMLAFLAVDLRKGPAVKNMALKTSTIFLSLSRLHRRAINYKVIYDQPYGRVKLWSELSASLKATLRVSDLSFGSHLWN